MNWHFPLGGHHRANQKLLWPGNTLGVFTMKTQFGPPQLQLSRPYSTPYLVVVKHEAGKTQGTGRIQKQRL